MPSTADIHIDEPPTVEWKDGRMHFHVTTGGVSYTRILTRYASVGLYMGLQEELAKDAGITPRELCLRIAEGGH